MINKIFLLYIYIYITSCQILADKKVIHNKVTLDSIYINTNYAYNFTDEGSFWLLYFNNGNLVFDFGPNSGHEFLAKKNNNEIVFYFDSKKTCGYDKDFDLQFKGIKSPIIGQPFGKLHLINDTTLIVNYFYKDWIKKINEKNYKFIDTLFPERFKRIKFKE